MSNFEGESSDVALSAPGATGATSSAVGVQELGDTSSAAGIPSYPVGGGGEAGYSQATAGDGMAVSSEDMAAIMNEPTGETPSAVEMEREGEERRNAQTSADNLLPRDKLQNGFKHVRVLIFRHLPYD